MIREVLAAPDECNIREIDAAGNTVRVFSGVAPGVRRRA